jgi:prepilin-type N-terminal cleavage/methylation domain-containing protein
MMQKNGFTLLELMIVMVIVGVLMTALLMSGAGIFGQSAEKETLIRLQTMAALLEQHRTIEGDYPDDRLPKGLPANTFNSKAEALFLALFDAEYGGEKPNQDWLVNTDGDETSKPRTELPSPQWMAGLDEEYEEQVSGARRNETTGGWEEPGRFQLISAGPDGYFDTEDDITHFGN